MKGLKKPAKPKEVSIRNTQGQTVAVVKPPKLPPGMDDLAADMGPDNFNPGRPQTMSEEAAEERAEEAASPYSRDGVAVINTTDPITQAVCQFFKARALAFTPGFSRMDFPFDEQGNRVKVSRLYHGLNLCLDLASKDQTDDEILYRKASIERLGFKYTWMKDGERAVPPEVLFDQRLKPAPASALTKFKTRGDRPVGSAVGPCTII